MQPLDRRRFLLASSALVLAACSDSPKSYTTNSSNSGNDPVDIKTSENGFDVAQRFNQEVLVPGFVRLPISLANKQALLSDGPAVINAKIINIDTGKTVIPALSAKRRKVTEALSYWDFHAQLDEVGIYALIIDGGTPKGGAIQINDPATVLVPYVGQQLPPFDTPTTDDPRGVNPICTRLAGGPCPFHEITLTEALTLGKPVVYVVGTPAHCEFGTCAPGLEALINAGKRLGDKIVIVHADVYTDDSATVSAPAVDAYHLTYEPVVWMADATGKIVARLDALWNQDELDEVLNALVG
ncbi:MAG: hypothetical protein NTX77_02420 [Actinobacteria bacterium]|nr:hypothetical protein [Actinomycetota bacterium]